MSSSSRSSRRVQRRVREVQRAFEVPLAEARDLYERAVDFTRTDGPGLTRIAPSMFWPRLDKLITDPDCLVIGMSLDRSLTNYRPWHLSPGPFFSAGWSDWPSRSLTSLNTPEWTIMHVNSAGRLRIVRELTLFPLLTDPLFEINYEALRRQGKEEVI